MFGAIFFDLDGTLCAPAIPFRQVFGDAVAPLLRNHSGLTVVDMLEAWGNVLLTPGPSTTSGCFERALAACGIAAQADRTAELAVALNVRWAACQALFPDVQATLQRLGAFYPLGLITNGPSDAQRAVVGALGLAPLFRWLLVSGDTDIGVRKPDPAIFQRAAGLAGCVPAALLYVGDSAVNDIAGAHAAGWRTCWLNRVGADFPSNLPPPDAAIRTMHNMTWPGESSIAPLN